MKTKTLYRWVLAVMLITATTVLLSAQTTPKKTTTTKKTTIKKKPATKAGKVFICDGAGGYHFHSRKTCAVLSKCKGRVLDVTKKEALGDWGRKQCKSCY